MFRRGQKIIILESSVSKRAHPAVGDIGYLNNIYLFFKDRFILLDIFFLSYKSDIRGNKDRVEKKRFLIDLGIEKRLKYKLCKIGMPRKFFTKNPYVANLTPAGYSFDEYDYNEYPTVASIWPRTHNKQGKNLLNTHMKIPCGQIAVVPHNKRSFSEESNNTIRCWINSLAPLLVAEIGQFVDNSSKAGIRTIYIMASNMYYSRLGEVLQKGINTESTNLPAVIKDLRLVQVLSEFFLNSCDKNFLKSMDSRKHRGLINLLWRPKKCIEILINNDKIPKHISDALISIFFRSLLTTKDTESQLLKMKTANFLPWSLATIHARAKKLEKIKLKANSNSAALNRIFEESLF